MDTQAAKDRTGEMQGLMQWASDGSSAYDRRWRHGEGRVPMRHRLRHALEGKIAGDGKENDLVVADGQFRAQLTPPPVSSPAPATP